MLSLHVHLQWKINEHLEGASCRIYIYLYNFIMKIY